MAELIDGSQLKTFDELHEKYKSKLFYYFCEYSKLNLLYNVLQLHLETQKTLSLTYILWHLIVFFLLTDKKSNTFEVAQQCVCQAEK